VTNGFKLISGKAFSALYRRHHVVVRVAHLKLDFVQTRRWPATEDTSQLNGCFLMSIKNKLRCKTLQICKTFFAYTAASPVKHVQFPKKITSFLLKYTTLQTKIRYWVVQAHWLLDNCF